MISLLVLYLLLPLIQIYFYLSSNFTFDFIEKANYISSITLLHWMLSNVLIASKIPMLQKLIPYDRRVKAHIIFSSGAIFLALYHGLYKFLVGYSIGITAIPLAITFGLFVFISVLWIRKPNLINNYEINKKIHVFSQPILGLLIAIHIYSSGLFHEVPKISAYIYLSLFTFSYSMFILSKTTLFKTKAKIVSVRKIKDLVMLDLSLSKSIRYNSGQFSFLGIKNSNGVSEEHPFSFLSVGEKSGKNVSFAIKALGDFTTSLGELKVDDQLWIRGSYGNFRPKKNNLKPITLIGSGIGIVPLISIFKELYENRSTNEINLFIAVNNREEILDMELLIKADKEMDNVTINYLIYQEDGLLFSSDYFSDKLKDPTKSDFYICSSPGVRKIIISSLKPFNIKKSQIHYEAFSF